MPDLNEQSQSTTEKRPPDDASVRLAQDLVDRAKRQTVHFDTASFSVAQQISFVEKKKPETIQEKLIEEQALETQSRESQSILKRAVLSVTGVHRENPEILNFDPKGKTDAQINAAIEKNKEARLWEHDVAEWSTGFLKTMTLFARGKVALQAAAVTFALDEVKPGSTSSEAFFDGTLGAGKGLAAKGFLHWSQGRGYSPGATGVLLGGSMRLSDSALTRANWIDKNGDFTPGNAAEKVVTNTLNPAAVAVDYAIFRTAHGATGLANKWTQGAVERSPYLKTVVTGQAFGLSSGFSGEAMRQYMENDFNPKRLVTATLVKGALDGVAAMPGGYQASRAHAAKMTALSEGLELSKANGAGAELLRVASLAKLSEGNIQRFEELKKELGTPEVRQETYSKLKDGPLKPHEDFAEWAKLNLEPATRKVNVYKVDGVEIIVPEKYDAQLGKVRNLTLQGKLSELANDPEIAQLKDRILPEEVIQALRSTPRPDFVSKVRLLDETNPQDAYAKQMHPEARSSAAASADGDINLYRSKKSALFGEDFLHEWSHLAKWIMKSRSYQFDLAAKAEEDGHFANNYARKGGVDENWAVHASEELSNPDITRATRFAEAAPVRSSVLMLMLKECLDTQTTPLSPKQAQIAKNIETLLEPTLDRARTTLVDRARSSGDKTTVEETTKLLLHIGRPQDIQQVKKLKELNMSAEPVDDVAIKNLPSLPGVQKVNLSGTQVGDGHMESVGKIKGLETAILRRTNLGNIGLETLLRQSLTLKEVDVTGNLAIDAQVAPSIIKAAGSGLGKVNLAETSFTPYEIAQLRLRLPHIEITGD